MFVDGCFLFCLFKKESYYKELHFMYMIFFDWCFFRGSAKNKGICELHIGLITGDKTSVYFYDLNIEQGLMK